MSSKQRTRCPSAGRTLRFGVIGAGGMGRGYCRIMRMIPHVRLTAVCDENRAAAAKKTAWR